MAHIELVERPRRMVPRFALRYSRRRFGRPVEPVSAAAHHSGVLVAMGVVEAVAERSWRRLDADLRWLAVQAAAARIGCSWCMDFGYHESVSKGADPRKVREVARFRESDAFDDVERAVLAYTEAATATPAEVGPELVAELRRHLDEEQIVELAAWVALENYRSRFNAGLGLRSQGFAESCEVPLARVEPGA
jgi:alkylhydroperoxidase family enzyme